MKKTFLSIAFILSFLISATAHVDPAGSKPFSSVSYIGSKENGLAFDLFWDIISNKDVTVSIFDDDSEIIYRQTFKEKKSIKRFLLPRDSEGTYTFLVRSGEMSFEKSFTVSRELTEIVQVIEE